MLINMFKSCGSVRTVLRNFRLNSYLSSAAGVAKKKRNVWFLKVPDVLKSKGPEEIENLKIVPEGYKLIYHSRELNMITFGRLMVFFLFATGTWVGVQIYFQPESINLREGFFTKEETVCMLLIQAVVIYVFITRHVYYIFRKENSYKTVYYGLFGKLQPRIIDHEAKELLTPDPKSLFPFFHYLKGKPVVISISNFTDKMEESMLIKRREPKK